MAKKKTRILWLSRDGEESSRYELWFKKPTKRVDFSNVWNVDEISSVAGKCCPEIFEKAYPNCKLEPGQCCRVKITMVFG